MKRFLLVLALVLGFAGAARAEEFHIGYQKNGPLLIVKQQGTLDRALSARGVVLKWYEFPSGPPMVEALNAGSIDFIATGDMPPIFAQSSGVGLVYTAYQPVNGASYGIVVPKDSPIHALSQLKGKRIALVKGSSAHNLLVHALDHAHIDWRDITPVYLAPGDAASAFQRGSVDAWAIWDPFYALAELKFGARRLTDAAEVSPTNNFFLARGDFANRHPEVIRTTILTLRAATDWAGQHRDQLARILADASGVPVEAQALSASRYDYSIRYLDDQAVARQQGIADRFYQLGLIPKPVAIRRIVWKPVS